MKKRDLLTSSIALIGFAALATIASPSLESVVKMDSYSVIAFADDDDGGDDSGGDNDGDSDSDSDRDSDSDSDDRDDRDDRDDDDDSYRDDDDDDDDDDDSYRDDDDDDDGYYRDGYRETDGSSSRNDSVLSASEERDAMQRGWR